MSRSDEIYKKIVIRLMRKLYKKEYEGVEEVSTPDLVNSQNNKEGLEITCIKKQSLFRSESRLKDKKFYTNSTLFDDKTNTTDFIERAENALERKMTKDYSRCSKVDLLLFDEGFADGSHENELYEILKSKNTDNRFGIIYLFFYREGVYINDFINNTHRFIKLDRKNKPLKK